jgi:uncharacterized protein (DUF1330 family)
MIIEARITDPVRFRAYAEANPPLVERYGGRYVAMRGLVEALEGALGDSRIVMSEWPDLDAARRYWRSPEYAAIRPLREGCGEFRVLLVEGLAPEVLK